MRTGWDWDSFSPCVSGKTYDPVAVGTHTFNVRASDPATGTTDVTPATRTWTVDPTVIACKTNVPAGLVSGETWTSLGSPYCVQGDIQVSLLTINPGVEVLVDGAFEIRVLSTITAIGTVDQPILFSSLSPNEPANQRWKGIKFQNTPPGSELTHVNVEFSDDRGISLLNSGTIVFSHCAIRNNTTIANGGGMSVKGMLTGDVNLVNCTFSGNSAGVHGGALHVNTDLSFVLNINGTNFEGNTSNPSKKGGEYIGGGRRQSFGGGVYVNSSTVRFSSSILSENTTPGSGGCRTTVGGGGLYVNAGSVTMVNTVIAKNLDATGVHFSGGTLDIKNSIIYFNNGDGVQIDGVPTAIFSDVQGGFTGVGNINFNPVFSGTGLLANDFKLAAGSPATDAGNPALEFNDICFPPSLGTALNDMGAYGGPLACNWP